MIAGIGYHGAMIGIRLGFYRAWNDVSGRGAEAWSRGRARVRERVRESTLTRLTLWIRKSRIA